MLEVSPTGRKRQLAKGLVLGDRVKVRFPALKNNRGGRFILRYREVPPLRMMITSPAIWFGSCAPCHRGVSRSPGSRWRQRGNRRRVLTALAPSSLSALDRGPPRRDSWTRWANGSGVSKGIAESPPLPRPPRTRRHACTHTHTRGTPPRSQPLS